VTRSGGASSSGIGERWHGGELRWRRGGELQRRRLEELLRGAAVQPADPNDLNFLRRYPPLSLYTVSSGSAVAAAAWGRGGAAVEAPPTRDAADGGFFFKFLCHITAGFKPLVMWVLITSILSTTVIENRR